MKDQRSDPGKQRQPSFAGKVIVDTWKGKQRVRAWPRKRGPSKSLEVRQQNAWFKAANLLAKLAAPSQIKASMEATKGTGLYPRDLIVRSMGQGLFDLGTMDGKVIRYRQDRIDPVSFQGAIVELASPIAIGFQSTVTMVWPLPLVDTASFWDISAASRLTVPAGVTECEVLMRTFQPLNKSGQMIIRGYRNGIEIARDGYGVTSWHGATLHLGHMAVEEGDYFQMKVYMNYSGGSADASGRTAMSLHVTGTD